MKHKYLKRWGRLLAVVFGSLALAVAAGWWGMAPLAAETEEVDAFPFLAGFPRTDPSNIEFAGTAVADIDNDGDLEIVTADGRGRVWAFHHNGNVVSGYPLTTKSPNCATSERINGPVAVGNISGDTRPEIAAGTRGCGSASGQRGRVYVWNSQGSTLTGWPKDITWNSAEPSDSAEVYSVALANVWNGGLLEVIAGTNNSAPSFGSVENINTSNLYVWRADGTTIGSYPTWYKTAGIWGAVATADIDGDGGADTIVGRDHVYVAVYNKNGQPLPNFPLHTPTEHAALGNAWGSYQYGEFTRTAPAIGDLDGDGVLEMVFHGKVRSPGNGHNVTNNGLWVVEKDGTRMAGWENAPLVGDSLYDSFGPMFSTSLGDLGRNGSVEIAVPYADGYLRVYRPDGSLYWSYNYAQGKLLFASEVVIGDVSGDGLPDVVFGTYAPTTADQASIRLIALHGTTGQMISGFPLTLPNESGDKRGLRSAPTLTDLDRNCDVEIIGASWSGVIYVWDLDAPYYWDQMLWPTARHDNQRTGSMTGSRPASYNCDASRPFDNHVYLPVVGH